MNSQSPVRQNPEILICTHRRPHLLMRLLRSLNDSAQFAGVHLRISVINNDTIALAVNASQWPHLNIIITEESRIGLAFARNRAIAESTGENLLFLDDDQVVPRDFMMQLQRVLSSPLAHGAAVRLAVVECSDPNPSEINSLEPTIAFAPAQRQDFGCGGLLISRAWLSRLGAEKIFDPRLNRIGAEDTDLYMRASAAELPIFKTNLPIVYECADSTRISSRSKWLAAERKGYADIIVDLKNSQHSNWFWANLCKTAAVLPVALVWSLLSGAFPHAQFRKSYALLARQIGKLKALFGFSLSYYPHECHRPVRIISTQDLRLGGAEKIILDLARPDSNSRFDSQLFLYHSISRSPLDEQAEHLGIDIVRHHKSWRIDLGIVAKLNAMAGWLGADIYHSHDMGSLIYGAILKVLRPRMKLYHTVHTLHTVRNHSRYRMLTRLILDHIYTKTVAVGASVQQELETKFGISAHKIEVIANGVDISRFAKSAKNRSQSPNAKRFIRLAAVSRVSEEKRIHLIVETMAQLQQRSIAIELHHFGSGDDQLLTKLKNHSQQLGVDTMIHWHGFTEDIASQLCEVDGFVSASAEECHPVSVVEAICSHLPVFISDIPAHHCFLGVDRVFVFSDSKELSHLLERFYAQSSTTLDTRADIQLSQFDTRHMHAQYDALFSSHLLPVG